MNAKEIITELQSVADSEKANHLQRFFKTKPGQYGEGDLFLGITVPIIRDIAKANKQTPVSELQKLLRNKYHEIRLCALLITVEQYKKAGEEVKKELFDFYLKHTDYINNWDLVDLSCPEIVGGYLLNKERSILYQLAENHHLWEQRIAIVSTQKFIRNNDFGDTFELTKKLINHSHDLIHKAMGWMLREVGKRDRETLTDFLEEYTTQLPRTTLRYAIEHYPESQRQHFLKKK